MNIHHFSFDRPLKLYSEFLELAGNSVHRIEEPLGYLKGSCELNFILTFHVQYIALNIIMFVRGKEEKEGNIF